MPQADVTDDREADPHGVPWVGYPKHDRVADQLDLTCVVGREQFAYELGELFGEVGGGLVAVRLSHRREPGKIGKQERVLVSHPSLVQAPGGDDELK